MISFDKLEEVYSRQIAFLRNSVEKDRLSHAYIFHGPNQTYEEEIAKYVSCMLYGGINFSDEDPNIIQIKDGNHLNVIVIRPNGKSVKKEQIMALQEEFSKTSLVNGPRIYIITYADTMTGQAMNSLLKFIEEPIGKETYGFLITSHLDNILPTIKSRAISLSFEDARKDIIRESLEQEYDMFQIDVLSYLSSNYEDAKELAETDSFQVLTTSLLSFVNLLKDNNVKMFVRAYPNLFSSRDNTTMFLSLLEGIYLDMLEYIINGKINKFLSIQDSLIEISKRYSSSKLLNYINEILKLEKQIPYYVNINLNMDELLWKLSE